MEQLNKYHDETVKILAEKSARYAGPQDPFRGFKITAEVMGVTVQEVIISRMMDKVTRYLNHLAHGGDNEDTLRDLHGYLLLLIAYEETQEESNKE